MINNNHAFWIFSGGLISSANIVHRGNNIVMAAMNMRKAMLFILILTFSIVSVANGEVSTRVCLADGETPLPLVDPNVPHVYQDIMVGTELTIIVTSDANVPWFGDLAIAEEDVVYGLLSARDYNDVTLDWEGSRFSAAGDRARVWDLYEPGLYGFSFVREDDDDGVAGDWFIIDYTAIEIGHCSVWFYSNFELVYYLLFSHVYTRDFDDNANVNFVDFAILASHWQRIDCSDPEWCAGIDLGTNGKVDINDLILFCDYWLEKTR